MRTIAEIEADERALISKIKRLTEQLIALRKTQEKLKEEKHKSRLIGLVGIKDAVRYCNSLNRLDRTIGTLTRIDRKRGTIDLGEVGVWSIELHQLQPVTDR